MKSPVVNAAVSLCLFAGCPIGLIQAQTPAPAQAAQTQTPAAGIPGVSPTQAAKAQVAEPANPKYAAAMAEGKQLEQHRQYIFAIDSYKKANKIAGGQDRASLQKLYDLQIRTGSSKDAIGTAATLESVARTPVERSIAESERGRAILQEAGDKGKAEKLEAADAAFKAAIADSPKNPTALYLDGMTLARLHRMEAASERFKQCLSCMVPNDPSYTRAQHFAENPALSLEKMAPAFTVVALDGSKFNLDEMGGRVVLIDFWATWCGPCNEELPHMQKIAKEFAGQPLVILSVSWDSDEAKWKEFLAKHEMTWMQYRDADHELSKRFEVHAIPHYFTIDADGVLTAEMMGSGSDVEGKLKKLIALAKAARPPAAAASAGNE